MPPPGPPSGTITAPLDAEAVVPDGSDLSPGARVGEYLVERKVGLGGMGSVYAAVHPVIGKKAAIKVIAWDLCRDPAFVARFVAEARAVNLIAHPNIVESFSIGALEDGRSYYVMEWLEGISLADRLRRGPVPLGEALAILDDTADALQAVHGKGIVHRDLTPRNLFLVADRTRGQTVKVFDFGLAKRLEVAPDLQLTRSGVMIGTPLYASPEQLCGDTTDHRSDVYSLGVIAWELVLGRRPYEEAQLRALVTRKLTEPPPAPRSIWPDIPLELEWLLTSMLSIEADRRPDLTAVRAAIARLRAAGPPPVRRRRGGWIALAVIAAGGMAAAGIGLAGRGDDHRSAPAAADAAAPDAATEPAAAAVDGDAGHEMPYNPHDDPDAGPPRRSRRTSPRKSAAPERAPAPPDPDRYLLEPGSR